MGVRVVPGDVSCVVVGPGTAVGMVGPGLLASCLGAYLGSPPQAGGPAGLETWVDVLDMGDVPSAILDALGAYQEMAMVTAIPGKLCVALKLAVYSEALFQALVASYQAVCILAGVDLEPLVEVQQGACSQPE